MSGLERGPGCHPERSEGSLRPASQTRRLRSEPALERSEGVTGLRSKCLGLTQSLEEARQLLLGADKKSKN